MWELSHRADPRARVIADRHYNRQKIGSPQFVPPGRCLVLWQPGAFWVTSYPYAQYVKHAWAGAWVCSAFRREDECAERASDLIRDAVAHTLWRWPDDAPEIGMVTFIDPRHVRPTRVRGEDRYGWTYEKAGFRLAGQTKKDHLLAFVLAPNDMPQACPWKGWV